VSWPTPDGRPVPHAVAGHAAELRKGIEGSVTPEESGLVDRRVQCHRCEFAEKGAIYCGLFAKINKALPEEFDLNPKIHPHGCCNAQQPRLEPAHKGGDRRISAAMQVARSKTKEYA
jgi:hypothetical protein